MLTKGAIGNLVNRYRAVLGKCKLINTFGSLAVAAMFVAAAPLAASAVELTSNDAQPTISGGDYEVTAGDVTLTGAEPTVFSSGNITIGDGLALTMQGANDDSTLNGTIGFYGNGTITGAAGNLNVVATGAYSAGIGHGSYTIDVNELSISSGNFGIYTATNGDKTITANKLTINAGGDAVHVQGAHHGRRGHPQCRFRRYVQAGHRGRHGEHHRQRRC